MIRRKPATRTPARKRPKKAENKAAKPRKAGGRGKAAKAQPVAPEAAIVTLGATLARIAETLSDIASALHGIDARLMHHIVLAYGPSSQVEAVEPEIPDEVAVALAKAAAPAAPGTLSQAVASDQAEGFAEDDEDDA